MVHFGVLCPSGPLADFMTPIFNSVPSSPAGHPDGRAREFHSPGDRGGALSVGWGWDMGRRTWSRGSPDLVPRVTGPGPVGHRTWSRGSPDLVPSVTGPGPAGRRTQSRRSPGADPA